MKTRPGVIVRGVVTLVVAVALLWRDGGPRVEVASAHLSPDGRAHPPLGQLLADFRGARATIDRSGLVMSKVDSNKQRDAAARPASRPVSPAQMSMLQRIEDGVASIRGLSKQADVPMELLDRAGLRDFLMSLVDADDAIKVHGDYLKLLRVLGLQPRDGASIDAVVETLVEHMLGFYDSEAKYMVLINGGGALGAEEKVTYAHEFTHALQDQHFDLTRLTGAATANQDRGQAARALVEGDATYSMLRWAFQELTPKELFEFFFSAPAPTGPAPSLDGVLAAAGSAGFTYGQGMRFVHHLHNVGGFGAVNQALLHPPTTTEQIFHPEKYLRGEEAVPVELPLADDLLGLGWTSLIDDSLGMLGVGGLVAEYADGRAAERVANGWGGDHFSLLEHADGRVAFVLRTVWDSQRDAVEFQNAMSDSQRHRFGLTLPALSRFSSWQVLGTPEYSTVMARDGLEVLVTIASDELVAHQVASRLGFTPNW